MIIAHDQAVTIGDLRVTAVAMHDPGAPGCNGYVIEHGGATLLQAGDTLSFDGFLALGQRWRFDAVCFSVGSNPPGKTCYLDESGAARVARDTGARLLIPQHFDRWRGITRDPRRVRTATRWYAPQTRVLPARFQRRISLAAAS